GRGTAMQNRSRLCSRRQNGLSRNTVATAIALVLGLMATASARAQQSSPPAQQSTPPAPQGAPQDAPSTPQVTPSAPQATQPAPQGTPFAAPAPSTPAPSAGTPMPEIVVSAPKAKRAAGRGPGGNANSTAPLEQAAASDKTGTKLADLPQSVVVVPRSVVTEQGGTNLSDAVRDISGINIGGTSTYGFFDRFTIRGMDARIFSDQFPDGDQSNGFPHSMNGVQRIEVLKGPGSALFGSSTPGGSIDIIHFTPSAVPGYGISQQIGSFGSWTTSVFATGPTTVPGLAYRVDGLFQHSDGFRDLKSADYEVRPVLSWTHDNH